MKRNSHLFDLQYLNKINQNCKVQVKSHPIKGIGIFAKKPIKKDHVITYYKCKIFREACYKSPTNFTYTVKVPTYLENTSRVWIADIVDESVEPPKYGIPFVGYLANEASPDGDYNCYLDHDITGNYHKRKKIHENDFYVYKLIALRDIAVGEEICWHYGFDYPRNYPVKKMKRNK